MKDELIFRKTAVTNKLEGACLSCEIGVKSYCIKHKLSPENFDCDPNFNYKFVEAKPTKTQTEYEWKKERFELISNYMGEMQCDNREPTKDDSILFSEVAFLKPWLEENKPEKWVVCTKGNTKPGDTVRSSNSHKLYEVESFMKFPEKGEADIIRNDGKESWGGVIRRFEINIAEK